MRTLTTRALNRALLERQMLRHRRRMPTHDAVERLVALQAQVPRDPYVALWSRLDRFQPGSLSEALADRRAVRMPLLRATLHLVSARDALSLRPVVEPALRRTLYRQSPFGRRLEGLDVDELMAVATELLEERPRRRADLTPLLATRWPHHDGPSLAYAVTYLLALVQVTPRGLWGSTGPSAFTTVQHWLGAPLRQDTSPDELALRYLAAFGPATPADMQAWSGLTGISELFEQLGPRLRTMRNDEGRELFDVKDGPLPHPDVPVPVRFLPEYDNVVLGHKDRKRIVAPEVTGWTEVGWGFVLVDGFTAARWKLERDGPTVVIRIEPFVHIPRDDRHALADEGERLARFIAPDAHTCDVSFAPARS